VPWHNHENNDELFYVVEGNLLMEIEDQSGFILTKGDLFVVKKEINHRVSSAEECLIMLIETRTTEHTGKVKSSITRSIEDQLY
jgi:mannose-6-phosphate isomerase-like protein (cupin superfamily)